MGDTVIDTKVPPVVPDPKDDSIKNMKAEMDRKLGNIERTNQALLAQLQAINKPPEKKGTIKDVWYDDPEKASDEIVDKAENRILTKLQKQNEEQAKRGTVIQGLYRDYPELQDMDNPLTVKAVQIFDKYSEEERQNPMAYKLAVKEAAEDMDLKPKSKRKAPADDTAFTLGDSGSGERGARTTRKKGELDPRTTEFGRLVGLDMEDEKTLERVKGYSTRSDWERWR